MNITYINREPAEERQRQNFKKGKSKKKRRSRFKFLLFTILFFTLVISLGLSPICNIKSINVLGSQKYKNDQLIKATDIYIGGNSFKILYKNINGLKDIYSLRYGRSEQNILKNFPYVKEALVTYIVPNEVSINITERTPICILPYQGIYLLMDDEGYAVDTVDNADKISLPLVKGINFDSYILGQALKVNIPPSIKDAFALLKAIDDSDKEDELKLMSEIKVIDVSDTNKVCLFIDNRIEVNLGNLKDLAYKLNFLKQIYFKKISKVDKGLIDFSEGENPDFMPEK